MEFLDGETLASRLRRGPIPAAEARAIGRQICAGLAEAHRHGVVHGDLKSSNVILTPYGKDIRLAAGMMFSRVDPSAELHFFSTARADSP